MVECSDASGEASGETSLQPMLHTGQPYLPRSLTAGHHPGAFHWRGASQHLAVNWRQPFSPPSPYLVHLPTHRRRHQEGRAKGAYEQHIESSTGFSLSYKVLRVRRTAFHRQAPFCDQLNQLIQYFIIYVVLNKNSLCVFSYIFWTPLP